MPVLSRFFYCLIFAVSEKLQLKFSPPGALSEAKSKSIGKIKRFKIAQARNITYVLA